MWKGFPLFLLWMLPLSIGVTAVPENITCRCDTYAVDNKPFVAIWNSPTIGCDFNFSVPVHLKKFGIRENDLQTWDGKEVTVFSAAQLGLYPYFVMDGQGNYNGGLPQSVDLSQHLRKARIDIINKIPDQNFKGLAVIDWEPWRPLWETNWNKKQIYKVRSVELVKSRYPQWSLNQLIQKAKQEFEDAGRALFEHTITLGKELRPKAYWGFYGFPDCFAHKENHYQCTPEVRKQNEQMEWLFSASTALFPSMYLLDRHPDNKDYVLGRLRETLRFATRGFGLNKKRLPIFVYHRNIYENEPHSFNFLNKEDLDNTIGAAAELGASGVVIWGNRFDENTSPEVCRKIDDYVTSTLGPYLQTKQNETLAMWQATIDEVTACSLLNCKGRGHCMKKSLLTDDLKMQFVDEKCGESNMLLEVLNASKNSLKGIVNSSENKSKNVSSDYVIKNNASDNNKPLKTKLTISTNKLIKANSSNKSLKINPDNTNKSVTNNTLSPNKHSNFVLENKKVNNTEPDILKPKRDGFSLDLGTEYNAGKHVSSSEMDQFFLALNGTDDETLGSRHEQNSQILGDFYKGKQEFKKLDKPFQNSKHKNQFNANMNLTQTKQNQKLKRPVNNPEQQKTQNKQTRQKQQQQKQNKTESVTNHKSLKQVQNQTELLPKQHLHTKQHAVTDLPNLTQKLELKNRTLDKGKLHDLKHSKQNSNFILEKTEIPERSIEILEKKKSSIPHQPKSKEEFRNLKISNPSRYVKNLNNSDNAPTKTTLNTKKSEIPHPPVAANRKNSITSDAVKPKLTQFGPVNHQNSQTDGTLLSNAQQQRTSIPLSTPKSNVTGSKLQTGRRKSEIFGSPSGHLPVMSMRKVRKSWLPHMYIILIGVSLGGALMFSLIFVAVYYYMSLRNTFSPYKIDDEATISYDEEKSLPPKAHSSPKHSGLKRNTGCEGQTSATSDSIRKKQSRKLSETVIENTNRSEKHRNSGRQRSNKNNKEHFEDDKGGRRSRSISKNEKYPKDRNRDRRSSSLDSRASNTRHSSTRRAKRRPRSDNDDEEVEIDISNFR